MVGPGDGEAAVHLARRSVARALDGVGRGDPRDALPSSFEEPRGVFVTLKRYPGGLLRGCIGYPLPVLPLRLAIVRAAVASALDDPRFPAVTPRELASLTFEVSILTVPVAIGDAGPGSVVREIRIGRDGLIVEAGGRSGLLLPQVAPEQGWTVEEFLDGTCDKAELPPGAWRSPGVRVRRFEAEIFSEAEPSGRIVRVTPGADRESARRAPRS
jgi:uncharacterized protein